MKTKMRLAIITLLVLSMVILLTGCQSEEAKSVDAAISSIGTVTLESEETISEVRQVYDALSEKDRQSLKNADTLREAEATLLMLKIDDAIGKYDRDEIIAFKAAYESLVKEYQSLPESQQGRISNYPDLEKAYAKWHREMEHGILGVFIDVLQSDFNPPWESSLDDLSNRYKTGYVIGDSTYYTEINLNGSNFEIACSFNEEDNDNSWIKFYIIGKTDSKSYSFDTDILNSLERNSGFLEKKDIGYVSKGAFDSMSSFSGTVYYFEDGKTVCMITESRLKDAPIIIVSPEMLDNPAEIYVDMLVGILSLQAGKVTARIEIENRDSNEGT